MNRLNQAYPLNKEINYLFKNAVYAGIFVTLFLFVFRPFGGTPEGWSQWDYFKQSAMFGLVTFLWTLINIPLVRSFPSFFNEEKWTSGREIGYNVFFVIGIGVCNMLYATWNYKYPITPSIFLMWQFITLSVSIFPIIATILHNQSKKMKQFEREAATVSSSIENKTNTIATNNRSEKITFAGDNQNEFLSISPEQLIYVAAADNYVQFYFLENDNTKTAILRSTLKKVSDALVDYPNFFRCHRTYLVNLDKVQKVSGNAQGLKLHLENTETLIPVSRTLHEKIGQLLES
jgi:hypothetical protein